MSVTDFLRYLVGREQTHEFALQLADVYDERPPPRTVVAGR